jgi:hypothetical protein
MPGISARMLVWIPVALSIGCTTAPSVVLPSSANPSVAEGRATAGDTVAISIFRVQPDKREQYERFVHEVFWPMGRRLGETDPEMRRVFGQTRVLHPVGPNEDGTYSYAFLFDPWLTGGEYSIEALLKRGLGEEEGGRIFREQFEGSLAEGPHHFFEFRQSPD